MKHTELFLILLTAVLSCSREQGHPDVPEAVPMHFRADIESSGTSTKTVLNGNSSAAVRKALWCPNDSIYVTNGTSSSKFINTEKTVTETAHFDGLISTGDTYFSAYPYQDVFSFSASSFVLNLPSEQPYHEDGFSSDFYPMVAQCSAGVFNFKNLCGIFVLKLTGTDTISSITFIGKDSGGNLIPVSGKGTVSMAYSSAPTLVMDSKSGTSVKLNCSGGVALKQDVSTTFHIVLPPATYQTFSVFITGGNGKVMTLNGTKPLTVERSGRITAKSVDFVPEAGTDLSIDGTANCYIVSESGKYKFKATVKGNSTQSVGTPKSAKVLWESFGTNVAPSEGDIVRDISLSSGYVIFTTPSPLKNGNAVISVQDASGNILWSWHIWVCNGFKPALSQQVYNNQAGTMMDRNLGSTSLTKGDAQSLGLLYQWGRKDPFLTGGAKRDTSRAKSTGEWPSAIVSSSSTGTLEYVERHPMQFITRNGKNEDWFYTGNGSTDTTRWQVSTVAKGIYDPCPAGWRVPYGGDNGVWAKAFGSSALFSEGPWDGAGRGMNFGKSAGSGKTLGDDEPIWYPAAGIIMSNDGVLKYIGDYGRYWSSSSCGNRAYSIYFNYAATIYPSYGYSRAYGQSVRCVSEQSGPVISVPTSSTSTVSSITVSSAVCGGNVTSDGGASVIERGVVWSTSQNPTVTSYIGKTTDGAGTGSFTSSITGLSSSTTYYVRSYATNSAGTGYGDQKTFTTRTAGNAEGYGNDEYVW